MIRLIILTVALPNLLFVGACAWLQVGRPYLNLDYALAAVLIATRLRWLGISCLAAFLLIDALQLASQLFPFVRLQDAFYLLRFTDVAPRAYQFWLAGSLLAMVLVATAFWACRDDKYLKHSLIVLNLIIGMMLLAPEQDDNLGRFWRSDGATLADSQLVDFVEYRQRGFVESFNGNVTPLAPASYRPASDAWLANPDKLGNRLLLIVNESWGASNDPAIRDALLAPLMQRHHVEYGELPFIGATVAGELRELCKLRPENFNLKPVTQGLESCLPNKLARLGYPTYAMHGATGLMYDRVHWYPRTGFEHTIFFENEAWPDRCHSFPGACDLDLREKIKEAFKENGKIFFYWLTLNTHSIYDERDIRINAFDCKKHNLEESKESCRNFRLQAQFFQGLEELLSDEAMEGTEVIVVGDHAPPIFDPTDKQDHYKPNTISWIKLTNKHAENAIASSDGKRL